jgi:polyisoprenoid-binding protein YceI
VLSLRFTCLAILLFFVTAPSAVLSVQAEKRAMSGSIDVEHSTMTVHVYRSGLFSFAGDNHEIQAPIAAGTVDEAARTVEFTVDVRRMRVLDPNLSADKRSQVQEKMLSSDVLDPDRYPEIKFRSTKVELKGGHALSVSGNLTLHGQMRRLNVSVVSSQRRYRGSATLKQTEFGIKPISIAGGAIKVRDEVRIDFEIVTRQP